MENEDAMVVMQHAKQQGVGLDVIKNGGKLYYFTAIYQVPIYW